jgi:hypothetical protein
MEIITLATAHLYAQIYPLSSTVAMINGQAGDSDQKSAVRKAGECRDRVRARGSDNDRGQRSDVTGQTSEVIGQRSCQQYLRRRTPLCPAPLRGTCTF